jgi:energy-coupling factor transporter ATP-binding protein EcfA2
MSAADPVVVSRIEIARLRCLDRLVLELAPPAEPNRGQWTIITGPNGAGKTTILRAVALALRDLSNPAIWPGLSTDPWCANGAFDGGVSVTMAGGERCGAVVRRDKREVMAQAFPGRCVSFPVFGYGSGRGSALGGTARAVGLGACLGHGVETLFREGASLIHAETWLKDWAGEAARDPERGRPIYDAVVEALRRLLGIEELVIRDRTILVSGPDVGASVRFTALGGGCLATAGWFIDLVARWIELTRPQDFGLSRGFLERMTGLVLLDELDLHLDTRWQIDIIPRVRALLPKMSFIVTTHSLLTLTGARPEEIWILSAEDGRVRAERSDRDDGERGDG